MHTSMPSFSIIILFLLNQSSLDALLYLHARVQLRTHFTWHRRTVRQSTTSHCRFEGCYASCLLAVLLLFICARLHIPQVDVTVKSYWGATFITVRLLFRELYSIVTPRTVLVLGVYNFGAQRGRVHWCFCSFRYLLRFIYFFHFTSNLAPTNLSSVCCDSRNILFIEHAGMLLGDRKWAGQWEYGNEATLPSRDVRSTSLEWAKESQVLQCWEKHWGKPFQWHGRFGTPR